MKTLILSSAEVRKLIDMREAIEVVRNTFLAYARKKAQMPAKIYLHLDKYNGDFRAMPAYVEGIEACGLKWVNVHPDNRRLGLPAVMGVIILSDPKNGLPLCIMDATFITALRTGAAGGIAAKFLSRPGSSVVALVGCGSQARSQLSALRELLRINTVYIYDTDAGAARRFLKEVSYPGVDIKAAANIENCVKVADIIVTTTPSRKPIIKSVWIKDGAHINAVGADAKGKEELDPALLKRAKIIVDDIEQACHSGEVNVPLAKKMIAKKDIHATLGEVLAGRRKGRSGAKDITIFDSTGLAIQDVAVAKVVYERAIKREMGRYAVL